MDVNIKVVYIHPVQDLAREFPGRVHAVRHEDICMDVSGKVQMFFDFFGLPMHQSVLDYIKDINKEDSANIAFRWKDNTSFQRILEVQASCTEAMTLWGYRPFSRESQMSEESSILPTN